CVATVPPIRGERMAFNHLSFWNPGMLLLNFGMTGFDMRSARLARYAYNVSIVARRATTPPPAETRDAMPEGRVGADRPCNGERRCRSRERRLQKHRSAVPVVDGRFESRESAEQTVAVDASPRYCFVPSGEKALLYSLEEGQLIRGQ